MGLIGMMWNITITQITVSNKAPPKDQAHKFSQYKLRHNRPLEDVDVVLIFVGDSHYLGACKYHLHSFFFLFSAFSAVLCGDGYQSAAMV